MAKSFEIPGLTESHQFLEYLLNPKKLAGLIRELETREAALNARITALGALEGAEAAHAQAQAALDEARELRRMAGEESAAAKTAAADLQAQAKAARAEADTYAKTVQAETKDRVRRLDQWDAALTKQEAALAEREGRLATQEADLGRRLQEMAEARTALEAKAKQLQAVLTG